MKKHMELAVQNIIKHGDTDIFPFPFENHAFFDKKKELVEILLEYHKNFYDYLANYCPQHDSSLTPAGYSGYRWSTQLDPIWNAYFLGCVLSIGNAIELVRIPKEQEIIFSYRYAPDFERGDLFDRDFSWSQFIERSLNLSNDFEYVVICDISEFYPRLGHHRLENALQHIGENNDVFKHIIKFLSNFSNTRSFGLPIGGPAARILSELTLNQVDQLLLLEEVTFTRFADDFHLFASNREEAYKHLHFLSEKLMTNQGLSLQKSKTRILTRSEFKATSPIQHRDEEKITGEINEKKQLSRIKGDLLRISIWFDPYSPTPEENYERLKNELRRLDIMELLRTELQKSRIHAAVLKKIIWAIKHLDDRHRDEAVLSLLNNCDVLYPIFSSVLILLDKIFDKLSNDTKNVITGKLSDLISSHSHIMKVDVHVAYAIRVLSHQGTEKTQALFEKLYDERPSPIIRRDIILAFTNWAHWYWLTDRKNNFRNFTGPERRAFIVASYQLQDEGEHWRRHMKKEFSPFEKFVCEWAKGKKTKNSDWKIPW